MRKQIGHPYGIMLIGGAFDDPPSARHPPVETGGYRIGHPYGILQVQSNPIGMTDPVAPEFIRGIKRIHSGDGAPTGDQKIP